MSRYVIDASVVLHLLRSNVEAPTGHVLLAPTLIRSEVLEALFRAVRDGQTSRAEALDQLARFARMKIRYLGDKVLRRQAWTVAERLGAANTRGAEYIALTQLQADQPVTLDRFLAADAATLVSVAGLEVLLGNAARGS